MANENGKNVDQRNNNSSSKENNGNPPNPFQRFIFQEPEQSDPSLKLSLGGIYNAVGPREEKTQARLSSLSIIGEMGLRRGFLDKPMRSPFLSWPQAYSRSTSLPVATPTQQKGKEVIVMDAAPQEANNKVIGNVAEKVQWGVNVKELQLQGVRIDKNEAMEKQRSDRGNIEKDKSSLTRGQTSSPSNLPTWAADSAAKSPAFRRAIDKIKADNLKVQELKALAAALIKHSRSKSSSGPRDSMPTKVDDKTAKPAEPKSSSGPKILVSAFTSGTQANGKAVKIANNTTNPERPWDKAKVCDGSKQSNTIDEIKHTYSVLMAAHLIKNSRNNNNKSSSEPKANDKTVNLGETKSSSGLKGLVEVNGKAIKLAEISESRRQNNGIDEAKHIYSVLVAADMIKNSRSKSCLEQRDSVPILDYGINANDKTTVKKLAEPNSSSGSRDSECAGASGKAIELPETNNNDQHPSKKAKLSDGNWQSNGADVMKQMPSVTAIGDGPNGKKVEGFLYKYTKAEVSIVCVCHGMFLSPPEFVAHAGIKDVTNPMKHISVSPSPPFSD